VLIGGLRTIGLIYGLVGLGGLVALLEKLMVAALTTGKGVPIPDDTKLALLAVGGADAAGAAFGFLVMYGVFTLRRWARYVLLGSGLLTLIALETLPRFLVDSEPVDPIARSALCFLVLLAALLVAISLTPSVKQVMTRSCL
jgi:hypothetical protein